MRAQLSDFRTRKEEVEEGKKVCKLTGEGLDENVIILNEICPQQTLKTS